MKPQWSDNLTRETFLELNASGLSAEIIAERMGVTPRTIGRWRRRFGVMRGEASTPASAEDREKARRLLEDGCSLAEAARSVGVAPKTVRQWFPDAPGWSALECGRFRMHRADRQGGAL